jgi:hypothetical protein
LFFGFGSGLLTTVQALAADLDHSAACASDRQPKQGVLMNHPSTFLITVVAPAATSFGAHAAQIGDLLRPCAGASWGASHLATQCAGAPPAGARFSS